MMLWTFFYQTQVLIAAVIFVMLSELRYADGQRTSLDNMFLKFYWPIRRMALNLIGPSGNNEDNVKLIKYNGRIQRQLELTNVFACDARNGPGKRSVIPPNSVHKLRPGDIDIIGAIGDSLTAGNGIMATNLLHITVENRGLSFSVGGQGTWREYLTLPNILKEFNPNLYGYSLSDGLSIDRTSKFNVAELGAMSRDIFYESKILVKRMRADSHVNMTNHWKLITILIGNNDFCSDMCFYKNPESIIKMHEMNMIKTLRYLRDHIPRLIVNIVPAPNLRLLTKTTGQKPIQCQATLPFECPCLINKSKKLLDYLEKVMKKWSQMDSQISYRDEFNTDTFTVNVQPFTIDVSIPNDPKTGTTDFTYFSTDCFHLSQKGQAIASNALWNNMMQIEGTKSTSWKDLFGNENIICPSEERPFIATRINSN